MEVLPERDSEKTDRAKNQPQRQSGEEFLSHHAEPIAQTQFAQSHRANHERGRLRSGIAAAGNNQRQKHRQDRGLFDLTVVTLHRGRGEHFSEEQNDQPGRSLLHHPHQRDRCVWLVQRFHTAEFLDVLSRFLFCDIEHVVDRDEPDEHAA